MSQLKATYTVQGTHDVIQVPLDLGKPLTESIIHLQDQVNTYLTKILEGEIHLPVPTVEQDEREQELKEMQEEDEEEEEEKEEEEEESEKEYPNDLKKDCNAEQDGSWQQCAKKQRTE